MTRIERYLLWTASTAFLSGLVVLTGIIWITQALRQIDLLTSKANRRYFGVCQRQDCSGRRDAQIPGRGTN